MNHESATDYAIVANQNWQIQSFPRRLLDPRRTKGKPTAEQAEEWLTQYDPLLPDDPKRVLSHHYQASLNLILIMDLHGRCDGFGIDNRSAN